MIVLKFGGTSVRDADWIGRALDIVESRLDQAPLLVSSAMGDTTDRLLELGRLAEAGENEATHASRDALERDHRAAFDALVPADAPLAEKRLEDLSALFDELATLLHGVTLIRDLSARSSDTLVSFGEQLATTIIAAAAEARGVPVTLLDSRRLIRTNDEFGAARPLMEETGTLVTAAVTPEPGRLYVAQGFLGATADGTTTTLGRGGSDFSATILGSALGAERVEIWTDVDGIMTADPRVIPAARTIPEISYSEAAELAYFGARVIHPATMAPAVEREIPVAVCNTGNPEGPKTHIVTEPASRGLRALAGREGVTIITLRSSRMLNAWGYLSRMFSVFEKHRVSVDLVATSEVSVSVSVDVPIPPVAMIEELEKMGRVTVDEGKAVVSLVGERLWRDPALVERVFGAVGSMPGRRVEMISLGSSDTNLSLVVSESDFRSVLEALHAQFFSFPDR